MTKKLRVGIISANWGAIAHLPAWRTLENVEVTAMCTSRQESAEAAAKQFGVARPFWNYAQMCADPDLDIIDIGTSPVQREQMVTAALNGGKHVVNNMPFAASLDGAAKLVRLQHAKGLQGTGAASVVGMPHVAMMKEMIDAGYLGDIFQIHCSWQMGFFIEIYPGFSYTWFGQAGNGTSVTRNQGSHMLHLLRHLFGPVRAVSARMKIQLPEWKLPDGTMMKVETDDTCHAQLEFANGAMGTLATSWTAADNPGFYLDVFGSKGRLRLETLRYPSADTAKLYAAESKIGFEPSGAQVEIPERLFSIDGQVIGAHEYDMFNGAQRISLARLFSGFSKSIAGGGDNLITFDRALEVQGLVEALYVSDASRAWVDTSVAARV